MDDLRINAPASPPTRMPPPRASTSGSGPAEKTAKDFEAVFIGQMTQLMFESVEAGEFSGGHGEQMFRGVLAEKLGGAIADRGGLGLAPKVLEQIIKLQGGNQ